MATKGLETLDTTSLQAVLGPQLTAEQAAPIFAGPRRLRREGGCMGGRPITLHIRVDKEVKIWSPITR
jgi:hypothetical protein